MRDTIPYKANVLNRNGKEVWRYFTDLNACVKSAKKSANRVLCSQIYQLSIHKVVWVPILIPELEDIYAKLSNGKQ